MAFDTTPFGREPVVFGFVSDGFSRGSYGRVRWRTKDRDVLSEYQ